MTSRMRPSSTGLSARTSDIPNRELHIGLEQSQQLQVGDVLRDDLSRYVRNIVVGPDLRLLPRSAEPVGRRVRAECRLRRLQIVGIVQQQYLQHLKHRILALPLGQCAQAVLETPQPFAEV